MKIMQTVSEGYREEPLGRLRENTKKNVISMRISDADMETLEQIMNVTRKSVSDTMRDAMELLKTISLESVVIAASQPDRHASPANQHN
jgi:hypothetical protein